MQWALCFFSVMLLLEKSESRSLCERRNLTIEPTSVHIDFEVAMHTVLKNYQCTFKIGL